MTGHSVLSCYNLCVSREVKLADQHDFKTYSMKTVKPAFFCLFLFKHLGLLSTVASVFLEVWLQLILLNVFPFIEKRTWEMFLLLSSDAFRGKNQTSKRLLYCMSNGKAVICQDG